MSTLLAYLTISTAILIMAIQLLLPSHLYADEVDMPSITRGGRIYDNWILENRDRLPNEPQKSFVRLKSSMHNLENSWRCVSCHGWDYHGVPEQNVGPLPTNNRRKLQQLQELLHDSVHSYQGKLSTRDFSDLLAFLDNGRIDMRTVMASTTSGSDSVTGTSDHGTTVYATICSNCHGSNGQKISTIDSLGNLSRTQPAKVLHNILNGHPAVRMPPLRIIPTHQLGELVAYLQKMPDIERAASVTRGGRLYDNWQKEKGSATPNFRHPDYPITSSQADKPGNNWRCKECHGWDYMGRDGSYRIGNHFTGIIGIQKYSGKNIDAVRQILMDKHYQYHGTIWSTGPLDYRDITDLANFIVYGQTDVLSFIDTTSKKGLGISQEGKKNYDVFCATCHGLDGDALATGYNIGDIARTNPWEALHKIRNGHPGETMPGLQGVVDDDALANILAYLQTLP